MIKESSPAIGVVALLLFSAGSVVQAGTLYSNLNSDPANVYSSSFSYIIAGTATNQYFAQGFSFAPAVTDQLAQVNIALAFFGGTNAAVVTLQANNNGLPGAVLESWNVIANPTFACCIFETLTSAVPVTLLAGTTYWLVATPGAADTNIGWSRNTTGATGPRPVQGSPGGPFGLFGTDDPQGAFRIVGADAAVPEPASVALALAGLLVLATRAARRK